MRIKTCIACGLQSEVRSNFKFDNTQRAICRNENSCIERLKYVEEIWEAVYVSCKQEIQHAA